jgi:hypothetical protein
MISINFGRSGCLTGATPATTESGEDKRPSRQDGVEHATSDRFGRLFHRPICSIADGDKPMSYVITLAVDRFAVAVVRIGRLHER